MVRLARRSVDIEHPMAYLAASDAMAREAAAASIVLLRNEDALLPLPAGTRVAIIGDLAETPRFQGAGSSQVNAVKVVQPLAAFSSSPLEVVGFAPGYRRGRASSGAMIAEAAELAGRADVAVVYIGLDEASEAEGVDRVDLDLPASQLEVLAAVHAANPATVVVLTAGSVVSTDWVDQAAAIVHSYLAGQAAAEAVVDVLTGEVNPSGRLAETYPMSLADTPTAGRFPARGRTVTTPRARSSATGTLSAGIPVRYPFGFGLGYSTSSTPTWRSTTRASSSPSPTPPAGTAAGGPALRRAARFEADPPGARAEGFSKQLLAARRSRRVRIDFNEYTFRHFDVVTGQWQVEPGSWQVMVGASCVDIRLTATVDRDAPVVARRRS